MTSGGRSMRMRWMVAAAAAVLAACSPRPEDATRAAADSADTAAPSRSALGNFLAGRLAHQLGDTRAAAVYYAAALDYDPDNNDLMNRAFTLMVAEGRIDAAVPLAERMVELDSDSPLPLLVLGVRDAREGRMAQAEARFSTLPRRSINVFLGPLLTAWTQAGQGKTDAALATLATMTQQTRSLEPLQSFHAGLINDLADRRDEAEQRYAGALTGQPAIRAVEAAGAFYQRTGHLDRAKDLYDRYHASHPDTLLFDEASMLKAGTALPRVVPDARAGLAEAMFDLASLVRQSNASDYAMVFARLALALKPDFPLAQMAVADLLSGEERLDEANALYRAIDPASPVHASGRLRLALNLDDKGDTDGALAELASLAKARPDTIEALAASGDLLRRHKRYAEAAQAYGQAIARLSPPQAGHWMLFYSRGISYERSHQWPLAEADFLHALELQPDQADVLNYLGYSWIERGMNLERARAMIERAVALRPRDGAVVDSLGWALYHIGEFQTAVTQLEKAVELKPEDPTINEHLGDAYWQVGRVDEARLQWQRAAGQDPEPEQADGLKEKVRTGEMPGPAAEK